MQINKEQNLLENKKKTQQDNQQGSSFWQQEPEGSWP